MKCSTLPDDPMESVRGFGWQEVVLGCVLSSVFLWLIGYLAQSGGLAGKLIYAGIALGSLLLFILSFIRYLIDCGPGRQRNFALWTIGVPFLAVVMCPCLLVPAVQKVRDAAERTYVTNNLKQIGLAHHNFVDSHQGKFVAATAFQTDKGEPGLSWRVALLPYLEEGWLYSQFHLDEPWDSPHNIKLLPLMPKVYGRPSREKEAKEGLTRFQVFVGPGTLFEVPKKKPPTERREGFAFGDAHGNQWKVPEHVFRNIGPFTGEFQIKGVPISSLICVVETEDAVPWTKPEDIEYDPAKPLPKVAISTERFHVLLADGVVRSLDSQMDESVFRSLIDRREPIRAIPD